MRHVVAVSLIPLLTRLVVGILVMAGFLWLAVRLISRMTRSGTDSPPGREPTDRIDDEDRPDY